MAAAVVAFAVQITSFGAEPLQPDEIAEVKRIVASLPSLRELSRHRKNSGGPDAATRDPNAYKEAREVLDSVKAAMTRLKTFVKPGTSVFTYPGLLAIGEIRYSPPSLHGALFGGDPAPIPGRYSIYYGTVGMEMSIVFDEAGIIIELKDLKRPY